MKKFKLPHLKKQIFIPIAIILLLTLATTLVVLYGQGYRLKKDLKLSKTGLLATSSSPKGAQIWIDGHLTTATDDNINLTPGEYTIQIKKEGYFPWLKKLKIEQGYVTKAKANLFPIAPQLGSIATLPVINPLVDPSGSKIAFQIASQSAKKNGIYVLNISNNTVSVPVLTVQSSSTQITDDTDENAPFSQATIKWSPDGSQLLAIIEKTQTTYLLNTTSLNETPRDVTAILPSVLDTWQQQQKQKDTAMKNGLKPRLKKFTTEDFKILNWSPDETKILYIASTSAELPLIIKPRLHGINNLQEQRQLKQGAIYVYDTKEDTNFKILDSVSDECLKNTLNCDLLLKWYPDSDHLIHIHDKKITIIEYDGGNPTTVYAGPFIETFATPWPTGDKIVILTNLGNTTVPPTLYTIGLK